MASPEMTQDIEYQMAHPEDNIGPLVIAAAVVCSTASIFAVGLRLYARQLTKSGFGKDDYMMIIALILHLAFNVMCSLATKYGLGRHLVFVTDAYHLGVCVISAEVLISLVIPAAETSVLLLYHRLFPQKSFRVWLWIVGSLVWATKIAFIVVTLKQCTPISKVWEPTEPGWCLSYWFDSLIAVILNIITDLMVLLMPVPLVWRLKLSRKQRLQLIFAFTVGSFTCISGIVRTVYTPGLAKFDITWSITGLAITCVVEGCLFVISGCIPTYVALLTHRRRGSLRSGSSKKTQEYGTSSYISKREKWSELDTVTTTNSEDRDKVKVTTDIRTVFEGMD